MFCALQSLNITLSNVSIWESCKKGYCDSDVIEYEAKLVASGIVLAPGQIISIVQSELRKLDTVTNFQSVHAQHNLLGRMTQYVRRCLHSAASNNDDMGRVQNQLVGMLQMMQAANKLHSIDWSQFPTV